ACKQLINDTIDWQYQEGIINKEKKLILSESLKVVDLAEQHEHGERWNAPDYHVNDVVCIDMKECYPASMRGQREYTPWFNRFRHPTHYLVRVAVNGELPENNITGFVQRFPSDTENILHVEVEKDMGKKKDGHLLNRNISCAIIDKFTQGGKINEKRLTHRLVTDESELDFLIKDCTDAGTFARRKKCPLGFILTYYERHQPQYTYLWAS
ncbi:27841_t:CDS:2, partial [Racocetra persica]